MTLLQKMPLWVLAIGLQALAVLVILGQFLQGGAALYLLGLIAVILMAMTNYYGEYFFEGIIDVREKHWPKKLFFVLAGLFIAVACVLTLNIAGWPQLSLKAVLPRLAVSLLLLWYGCTVIFSSFFLGRGVAVFMHNPAAWIFGSRTSGGTKGPGTKRPE